MKIGILSDSHDHLDNVQKAIDLFQEKGVSVIIHAGDIVSPQVLNPFKDCGMKLEGIFGNNDGEKLGLAKRFDKVGGTLHGDFADVEAGGLRFGVYHGTSHALLVSVIASGIYDVVVSGHTHKSVNRHEGRTLVLNPGSVHGFRQPGTVMLFDTGSRQAELVEL